MLRHIRSMVVIALAAGLMWNCGGERVTQSEIGTDEQVARPLSKLAAHQHTAQAVVMATLHRDGAPVSGCNCRIFALHCRTGPQLSVVGHNR